MNKMLYSEFNRERSFAGRLPFNKDLISSIEGFCKEKGVEMAVFSVIGAVSSVTLGYFDQNQKVYVSFKKEAHLEIASCSGNISKKDGSPFVHAHMVLTDEKGYAIGGHLFSETIIFAGEFYIQELSGNAFKREYDPQTGLMLWNIRDT